LWGRDFDIRLPAAGRDFEFFQHQKPIWFWLPQVRREGWNMTKDIKLPKPKENGLISIEETLYQRRSVRDFKKSSFSLEEVSQFLWAGTGKNLYRRTAPSAGATYPLEIYLVVGEVEGLEPGVYHYSISKHHLERVIDGDVRKSLSRAALEQRMIERAPISVIITGDYHRTTGHYGQRGIRYVHMEVGHVGQNISLQAVALNMGTVMIGAFDDQRVKEILRIEEEPLYIIPVGKI
jgi:SagB-type dehydrogenase family enzyme